MPGTVAFVVRAIRVTVILPSTLSTVHAAEVSTRVAVVPFFSRSPLSAMLKHAASAAARSSSGFDPWPSSKRDEKLYAPPRPVWPLNVPLPVLRPPLHTALAFRVGMLLTGYRV